MEFSAELRKEVLKKSGGGFLPAFNYLLQDAEIQKRFPAFKGGEAKYPPDEVSVLEQRLFVLTYAGTAETLIEQFYDDVIALRDFLASFFPDFRVQTFCIGNSFDVNGSLRPRSEKYTLQEGHSLGLVPETEDVEIALIFTEKLARRKISFELSEDEKSKIGISGPIEKYVDFKRYFALEIHHHGRIKYQFPQ